VSGVAAIAVILAAQLAGFGGALAAPYAFAAMLVFGVGLAFAGFLWWLSARSFALLQNPATTPEQLAALRELPMALPEGTVRAVLALIVGVIGLPMLLFSQALALNDAVAGYVNGIIAGVFGYYFGTRSNGGDALASRRMGEALSREQGVSEALRQSEAAARAAAAEAGAPERLGRIAGALERQVEVARVILGQLAPALPPGLVPAGAAAALERAEEALRSGRGDEAALRAAATALAGEEGPFPALLRAAAVLVPAATPIGGVATLLGLGWNLGAAAWRRFRARLLDAPHDPALFDPGSITPESAELRLGEAPIFARLFAPRAAEPGFLAGLLDTSLRADAAERLWTRYGGFADPAEAAAGLAEFRRALLAERVAADVTPALLARLPDTLRTQRPAFPQPGPAEAQAAMQALVLLLGELRERHIDPLPLLAEASA
jgi:hypothetical protein